ncbi:MAG: hypothetical protein KKE86_11590 [Planctomycetes bacterium]|nr:hypothetical protein [Planctomycetota bacterium]MBU4399963.1 hypothetical protein [Planctomycetota bacterium]MCG2684987.1 YCF48-related protein [Planctomycetales bacterium]
MSPLVLLAFLSILFSGADDTTVADARLNDVCFVDARNGWAVGDRGTVRRTDDGGKTWRSQKSGVDCTLWAVCFLDEQLGWAAGGFTRPYTHASTGVVLTTRDGGGTWTHNPKLMLPALRRIGFFGPDRGWAAGCRSAMYPSGAFATDDGGRSWRPLPGGNDAPWRAADFVGPRDGALAGRNGALAVVRDGTLESARADGFELRSFSRIRLIRPSYGWLIGEGGLLLATDDLGRSWRSPSGDLPKAISHFDFAALAVRGAKCWIAGSPGTLVFHTADAGRTWNAFPTGTTVPIQAMAFSDDQHGWAVGELGTILATDDGGRTWRRQRSGGSRAALLALFAEPQDVPLELIAQLAGGEGYLTAVEVLGRRDIELPSRDDVPLDDRLHEAVVRLGGNAATAAWQFPLRQTGLHIGRRGIVAGWDNANDRHGMESLRARMVRSIRTWRPEAVVTHDAGPETKDPLGRIVRQAVLQAVGEAADPNAFPDQIAEAGLAPWRVKRVFGTMSPGERGAGELSTTQFAPRLGGTPAEAAAEPRGLLRDRFVPSPPTLTLRPLDGDELSGRDVFAGLPPGSESRRKPSPPSLESIELLQRVAARRRHVQAIIERADRGAWSADQLLAQIGQLTRDLDERSAGQIIHQLADRYYRGGRWPLAAETFKALAERYPEHPLAPPAMLWLLHYNVSGEAAWRITRDVSRRQGRLELAVALGKQLERTRFDLFAEPAVRFPLAAAYRGLDQPRQAKRLYQIQRRGNGRDAWWVCAQGELRMADAAPRRIKPRLKCVKAESKPRLDGRLDDAVWKRAETAALESAQHDDGDWPAVVLLAYDAEFLYIAAQCRNAPNEKGDGNQPQGRPRDADLSDHDRVEVFLDIDRDYATFYRLTVDHRGWTNDRCWEDHTWNPTWYVAASRNERGWTAEAAIPLKELTGQSPQPRETWAIGLQRVAPGVGFQAWNKPAAVDVLPDGFGHLEFE